MQMLLGFSPFILFAVFNNVSTSLALWLAFAAAFAVGIHTFLHKRELRILDMGGVVLFGGLALYSGFIEPEFSTAAVRLVINGGLLLIVLVSLLMRRPFTLPYAKEQTPAAVWDTPVFLSVNMTISAAWGLAFAAMTAADVAALLGALSPALDLAIGILALIAAIVFSMRYPAVVRKRFGLSG
jgi:hypothetical protein